MRKIESIDKLTNKILPPEKISKTNRMGISFLVIFVVLFAVFTLLALPLSAFFWEGLAEWNAEASSEILLSWGVENTVARNIIGMHVGSSLVFFEVSSLCAGDLEIALLFALILATPGILFWKKLLGAILGTVLLLLINPLRITITLFLTNTSDLETGELYHSIIFRLFLFALLVLYYLVWYRLARRKASAHPKKKKKKA